MAFSSDSIARASVSTEVMLACAYLNLVWMSVIRRPEVPFGVIVGLMWAEIMTRCVVIIIKRRTLALNHCLPPKMINYQIRRQRKLTFWYYRIGDL